MRARVVRARGAVRVELSDPLGMARTIRVQSREHGSMVPMNERVVPAAASALVPVDALPDAPQLDYVVQVLDQHGNRLAELGTEDQPRVFGEAPVAAPPEGGPFRVPTWAWVVGGVLVAGAVAMGLGYGLRQEPITLRSSVRFE